MTESVEAPERIWIESEGGCPYFYHEEDLSDVCCPVTEYVRADKLRAEIERDEALLRQALEALEQIATDLPWELTGLQADTIAALSAALAEPTCKQSLQVAEQQGLEHISSPDCWCHPELDYKDPDTGAEVWVHRSMQ